MSSEEDCKRHNNPENYRYDCEPVFTHGRSGTAPKIVKIDDTKNTVVEAEEKDPFTAYGEATKAKNLLVGTILLFSKGDYFVNKQPVTQSIADIEFIANMDWMLTGWVHWRSKKPVATVMVRIGSGLRPCKRAAVGDMDEKLWEKDSRGNPIKPWQYSTYLPLVARTGEVYTFVTSSRGGIDATGELAARYGEHRKHNPDVFPLIRLTPAAYPHPDYGQVDIPKFVPAGYLPKTKFYEALKEAGVDASGPPDSIDTRDRDDGVVNEDSEPKSLPPSGKAEHADMDDEIPF
jgi:hypothetical protein